MHLCCGRHLAQDAQVIVAGQETLVIPGLGHRLTTYDAESGASGIVEAKHLDPVFAWLKKVS